MAENIKIDKFRLKYLPKIIRIYRSSFPKEERFSFIILLWNFIRKNSKLFVGLKGREVISFIYVINYKKEIDAKKIEDEQRKIGFENNIDSSDLTIVSIFFKEALNDLEVTKDNNIGTKNAYNILQNKLILIEKENDYPTYIKEGSKLFSEVGIYFGVGKYEKYLNAKSINGEVYFPLETAIPSYSEEELVGNIIITYLPNDPTPYVSESELEEFTKSKEIKKYINKL